MLTREDDLRFVEDRFILEWGRMSSSWGINRTMAQIHALLLITGRPHSMDEIVDRLGISRGNASMNLRDLMDWGVVQRFRRPGDRKDIYVTDPDPWKMVIRVVRERKRRELDPTAAAIRECLAMVSQCSDGREAEELRERLEGLQAIFRAIDVLFDKFLLNDETLRHALALFDLDQPPSPPTPSRSG